MARFLASLQRHVEPARRPPLGLLTGLATQLLPHASRDPARRRNRQRP
jgi:hypothetical protein